MKMVNKRILNFTIILLGICLLLQGNVAKAADKLSNTTIENKITVSNINYADNKNWAYYGIGENKDVDLFIICPTVDMGEQGNYNMSLDNEKVKKNFVGALNMEKGIYEDCTRMYAPYYRQISFPAYSLKSEETAKYLEIAYADVRQAFLYYMKNFNNGRPLIIAGFSQGSDMAIRLLKEFYNNEEYSKNLVAAYCIGWRITEDDIKSYPWLKMAQGEKDTGVIVSFNSEAEGIKESLIIPEGIKALGINPLNWKTDETAADSSQNKGACFTSYDGKIKEKKEHFSGAYIDKERGSLIVTDVNPSDYSNSLFPDGVYHLYDYQFFYRNLQENVLDRINAFKANQKNNKDNSNENIIDKGWNKINNIWYMINDEGQFVKGWYKEEDKWYYLYKETGAMKTGWFKDIDGKWYYLKSDGSMSADTTIDGYKIGNDGALLN